MRNGGQSIRGEIKKSTLSLADKNWNKRNQDVKDKITGPNIDNSVSVFQALNHSNHCLEIEKLSVTFQFRYVIYHDPNTKFWSNPNDMFP